MDAALPKKMLVQFGKVFVHLRELHAGVCRQHHVAGHIPVSYTHLDVYKRQLLERVKIGSFQLFLCTDGSTIRLELMGAVGRLYQPLAALHLSLIHISLVPSAPNSAS